MTFNIQKGMYYKVWVLLFFFPILAAPFLIDLSDSQNQVDFLLLLLILAVFIHCQKSSTLTLDNKSLIEYDQFKKVFPFDSISNLHICDTKGFSKVFGSKKVCFTYQSKGKERSYAVYPEDVDAFYNQLQSNIEKTSQS